MWCNRCTLNMVTYICYAGSSSPRYCLGVGPTLTPFSNKHSYWSKENKHPTPVSPLHRVTNCLSSVLSCLPSVVAGAAPSSYLFPWAAGVAVVCVHLMPGFHLPALVKGTTRIRINTTPTGAVTLPTRSIMWHTSEKGSWRHAIDGLVVTSWYRWVSARKV